VKELKEKIIKIALSHHLVSKYTSLVAVDVTPTRPVFEGLKVAAVANSIPRGSSRNKVVQGQYAQSATAGQLHITIGFMLILLCLLLILRQRSVLGNLKFKWRIKDVRVAN
jgi:Ca-activated chloride channel family protein